MPQTVRHLPPPIVFVLSGLILSLGFYVVLVDRGLASQVTSRSDVLNNDAPGATSTHSIVFTVQDNVATQAGAAGTSTITLAFPTGFDLSTITCGDIDVATGTQFPLNVAGGTETRTSCLDTGTSWGVVIDAANRVITLTTPTSSTEVVNIATGTQITVSIGSNAISQNQGSHWIANPSSIGTYTETVGGTFGGSGNILVAITNSVAVSLSVGETLSFMVSSAPANAISLVQHKSANAGMASSTSVPFSSNNTAGNWIGVGIRIGNQSCSITVTDSKNNAYRQAYVQNEPVGGNMIGMLYAENIAAGANTVTVSYSGCVTDNLFVIISEYSGVAMSNSLDAISTQQSAAAGTTATSGIVTPSQNRELLFGVIEISFSGTFTVGSGWTMEEVVPPCCSSKMLYEDQIQTTATAVAATATLSVSSRWAAGIATFKPGQTCAADDSATVLAINTTANTVPFGTISPNTFYQGCQDLAISTNAAQEDHALRSGSGTIIPDTSCDSGPCTATTGAAWVPPANNGFGHTCADQTAHDCNTVYASGSSFRQFASVSDGELGQAVMISSTPAIATGRVKYRLSAGAQQGAGAYSNLIGFIATPKY